VTTVKPALDPAIRHTIALRTEALFRSSGAFREGHFLLKSFEVHSSGRWQAIYDVKVEIENEPKPALIAEWIGAGFL